MNRIFSVLVAALLVASALVVAPAVAAQEGTTTTPVPSNATTTATASETGVQNVSISLGPSATIRSWEFRDGAFRITIHTRTPQLLSLTDVGDMVNAARDGEGATASTIKSRRILVHGTQTVVFRPTLVDGEGFVSIGSQRLVLLRTGSLDSANPAVPYGTVQGLLVGSMAFVAGLAVVIVRRRRDDETEEVEKIA